MLARRYCPDCLTSSEYSGTEAGEFAHTYNLSVVSIPTNRSMIRLDERLSPERSRWNQPRFSPSVMT